MPYVTIKQPQIAYQITFDDILDCKVDLDKILRRQTYNTNTRTCYRKTLNREFVSRFDIREMISVLEQFNKTHEELFEKDRESLYETFHIPKRSGGLRRIDAPVPELMDALRDLKRIFESSIFALYHTSAFAYVKGRSTIDSVKRHQQNQSRWFAKLDFSNFFGSTTLEFVEDMFSRIFPFSEIMEYQTGKEALCKALSLCFLNGGLPQGTPISPLITNIMMIPIDHQICNELRKTDEHFVYTRYADDLLISSKIKFDCDKLQDYVCHVLEEFNAPFILKKEKTRFGSSAGRNWNLGVMLNKDNEITIGHQKKKTFKAMCCNYICDKKSGKSWDLHDVQVFSGLISYYKMIEKASIESIITQNNEKFGVNLEELIKNDLRGSVVA